MFSNNQTRKPNPQAPPQNNASSLFLFRDESVDSSAGIDSKSSSAASSSSANDLKELSSVVFRKISQGDSILKNVSGSVEEFEAEQDDGHTEYKYKLVQPTPERIQHLVTQMNYRLTEGQGQAFYMLGVEDGGCPKGLSDEELEATIKTIYNMAVELKCEVFLVYVKKGKEGKIARLMVKRGVQEEQILEVRICIVGDADSGKSTLLGVLTTGKLDNGMGSARMNIFRHRHELEHGHTSSMSRQIIGFAEDGRIVNHDSFLTEWADIVKESNKLIMFIDLAGNKRYFKTTLFGLTSQLPDYALIAIAADQGISDTTKEHLRVIVALDIPCFVILTRSDLATPEQIESTKSILANLLSQFETPRRLIYIRDADNMASHTERMLYEPDVPVFQLSAVSGSGFDEFRLFLRLLRKPYDWANHVNEFAEFCIDEIFNIHRVGLVVTGIVLRGSISVGDHLLLGPFSNGDFRKVKIRSIHVHRTSVKRAGSGQTASLSFKRVKKGDVRKGMALVHPSLKPLGCMKFEAEITLLEGFKKIQLQHEPVLHIGTVNQSARITKLDLENLESVGSGVVQFEFKHQPEYIRVGSKLVFREGFAKGVGTVSRIVDVVGNRIDDDEEEDIDL